MPKSVLSFANWARPCAKNGMRDYTVGFTLNGPFVSLATPLNRLKVYQEGQNESGQEE